MTKKTQKPTQKALARRLKISPQLVSYHVKAGCPVPLNDVDGWRDYLAEVGREGSLPEDIREAIGKARARLLEAQAIRAERENKVAAGEMMLTADAERQAAEAMALTFSELERLCRECPPSFEGLPAIEIYKRFTAQIEKIRATLREKFESIGQ